MIAHLRGTILVVTDKYIILDVSGIGYKIFVTAESLLKQTIEQSMSLWISHIVREDAEELYGFETQTDHDLFEMLRSVSGIGPKSALGVMNVATIGTIARAVHTNDISYLTKISGIGRKTAEKIILELRDKLPAHSDNEIDSSSRDVLDALIALGFSESQARDTLRTLDTTLDTQSKIRAALKVMGKN